MPFASLEQFDSHDSVLPLFRSTGSRAVPVQFASAVLVQRHGEFYLLTPAHVVDEWRAETEVLIPISDGTLTALDGDYRYIDIPPEQTRSEDAVDIAYVRLAPRLVAPVVGAFTPVPPNAAQLLTEEYWRNDQIFFCSATGYPASKARRDGDAHTIDVWSYGGSLVTDSTTYERLGYSTKMNILLRYDRSQTINLGSEKRSASAAPHLKGVRGGGIFIWPETESDLPPIFGRKLIGIVHTYLEHEQMIVGTNLIPVFTMMAADLKSS